jgi:hypothetical protein
MRDASNLRCSVDDVVAIVGREPKYVYSLLAGEQERRALYPQGTSFLHGLQGTVRGSQRSGWMDIRPAVKPPTAPKDAIVSVPSVWVQVSAALT